MISAIVNMQKFLQKNTVVVESERSTLEVTLPSFTMCPWYNFDLAFSKSSKNLTELYESLLSAAQIKKDIKNISQPYFTKNEWVNWLFVDSWFGFIPVNFISRAKHIFLYESNYDMHPEMFSPIVIPDLRKIQGIQQCATYNPPGPTKPGIENFVCMSVLYSTFGVIIIYTFNSCKLDCQMLI